MNTIWGASWSEPAPGMIRIEHNGVSITATDATSEDAAPTATLEALQVATCQEVLLRRTVGGWLADAGGSFASGATELEALWRVAVAMGVLGTGEDTERQAILRELAAMNTRLTAAEEALQALIAALGLMGQESGPTHAEDCDMDEDCTCPVSEVAGG